MHNKFSRMGMDRGFPNIHFSNGFDDPFNDDFFNFGNNIPNRMNMNNNFENNRRNQNFEDEEEPKEKKITYVLDGKKITRTEEPYYENDGTVKIHVIEENEDGEAVDYFE